ncbi:hypothetical protein K8I31_00545, partial [bacterium]|nr:hypothetical protein [bacterium]
MKSILTLALTLSCFVAPNSYAQKNSGAVQTRSTFECISIYYNSEDHGECKVKYRGKETTPWKDALDLVYDARDKQYRGSIVGLRSGTEYEIQIQCGGAVTKTNAKTMSETFPVGKTTVLSDGVIYQSIPIDESGSAQGYHLVTVPENGKTVVDV